MNKLKDLLKLVESSASKEMFYVIVKDQHNNQIAKVLASEFLHAMGCSKNTFLKDAVDKYNKTNKNQLTAHLELITAKPQRIKKT